MENQEEKMVVEYQTQQGDLMRLTMNMVRKYLVAGKNELVTEQELVFFMHTCKARRLNPFLKDCHLVKYDTSPAAIITSIDYHRKNVRRAKDCKGWTSGIVIQKEDGSVEYREGTLIFSSETLAGGWAEAQPEGWPKPKRWTVNLDAYIKRKANGEVTQFWQPAKQPDMIAKVAEVQLLRQLWGEESTGMYTPEEMPSLEDAELSGPVVEIKEALHQEKKAAQDLEEKLKSKPLDLAGNKNDIWITETKEVPEGVWKNLGKYSNQISDTDAELGKANGGRRYPETEETMEIPKADQQEYKTGEAKKTDRPLIDWIPEIDQEIRDRFDEFITGRYGIDKINWFLIAADSIARKTHNDPIEVVKGAVHDLPSTWTIFEQMVKNYHEPIPFKPAKQPPPTHPDRFEPPAEPDPGAEHDEKIAREQELALEFKNNVLLFFQNIEGIDLEETWKEVDKYANYCAEKTKRTRDQIEELALRSEESFANFMDYFGRWKMEQDETPQSDKEEQEARDKLDPTHYDRYKNKRDPLKVIEYLKAFAGKFFSRPDRMAEAKEWFERRFPDHVFPLSVDKGKGPQENEPPPGEDPEIVKDAAYLKNIKRQINEIRSEDPMGLTKAAQSCGMSINPITIDGCERLLDVYWKMRRKENGII